MAHLDHYKIRDHSLNTQIIIKKMKFSFTQYKNEWKEHDFQQQNDQKKHFLQIQKTIQER